jgi:thiamine biosynthesis lipoprotein
MPRSTRREFLQGKAAADALADAAAGLPPGDLPEPAAEGFHLVKLSRRAMACQFEIYMNAGQYAGDTAAALAALDLVDQLEDQLSIYRDQSEIGRLNRGAFALPTPVEPRLFALLELAVQLHRETDGAYDVTAGPLSSVWGFTRRAGSIPAPTELLAARARVGSQFLTLDPAARTVRFLLPGMEINLGSIGKGYALDRSAEVLEAAGIDDFLLHGGNSSVLARGTPGGADKGRGWTVGVRNPLRPDRRAGLLRLHHRALATSGSGTQFFMHQGRRYGHILDPRSGWPAEQVLSVTVLAPTAARADALSTAMYVMGPDAARRYCEAHPDVAALMFCRGAREGSIERFELGLGEGDWSETGDC